MCVVCVVLVLAGCGWAGVVGGVAAAADWCWVAAVVVGGGGRLRSYDGYPQAARRHKHTRVSAAYEKSVHN